MTIVFNFINMCVQWVLTAVHVNGHAIIGVPFCGATPGASQSAATCHEGCRVRCSLLLQPSRPLGGSLALALWSWHNKLLFLCRELWARCFFSVGRCVVLNEYKKKKEFIYDLTSANRGLDCTVAGFTFWGVSESFSNWNNMELTMHDDKSESLRNGYHT